MNNSSFQKNKIPHALVISSLIATLTLGTAAATLAEDAIPQAHSDSFGAVISDTVITGKVKAKLMSEDSLKNSNIEVTTTNGVVTLKGKASNSDAKALAERAAKSVEGVKSVDNSLKTPESSATSAEAHAAVTKTERAVSDSWITTQVKAEILASSVSKGFDVSVKTVHGVVVLKGVLANQDAVYHVKHIAEQVQGVKSVDTSALTVTGD